MKKIFTCFTISLFAQALMAQADSIKTAVGNTTSAKTASSPDRQYFTTLPTMYPGRGVWSSAGPSFNLAVALKV